MIVSAYLCFIYYTFFAVTVDVTVLSCGYHGALVECFIVTEVCEADDKLTTTVFSIVHRLYVIKVRFHFFLYCVSINKSLLPCPAQGSFLSPVQGRRC